MPTAEYNKGFRDAVRLMQKAYSGAVFSSGEIIPTVGSQFTPRFRGEKDPSLGLAKPKRKLSAWNKFVKANSKKKIYQFANGKLKLKKMGIAFRKTRAGKKSRK